MPFEIRITRTFCASHQVRLHDRSLEPLHGHNWTTIVTVGAEKLDAAGFVVDFHDLEKQLDEILTNMNNRHLNTLPAFASRSPSAENVALTIAEALVIHLPAQLISVEVTEAPGCSAIFRPSNL